MSESSHEFEGRRYKRPEDSHARQKDRGIQEERIDEKREQPCPPRRWSDSERNMNTKSMGRFFSCLLFCVLVFLHSSGWSEEKVLNLYSSRHYESDQAVYDEFTRRTGIVVRRIEGSSDALLERIIREGENSPADVFMTVDAARLYRAEQADVFLPVSSHTLETRIPSNLRHPEGKWFAFSTRVRMLFWNLESVIRDETLLHEDISGIDPTTQHITALYDTSLSYEDLAHPRFKGDLCIRESANVYNQSLLASMIAAHGAEEAENWARNVVANFARDPVKGDTNQLRAAARGLCRLALANSYYYARLANNPAPEDEDVAIQLIPVFPNQSGAFGRGAHVNVSGGGVLRYAPHPQAAIAFMEYLAGDSAQKSFGLGNNEYPVVAGVSASRALGFLGPFKADPLPISALGANLAEAQRIFDRVGWK